MTVEEWKRKNPPIQRKPITNADCIRAMPDGELAKYLCGMGCPTGLSPNSPKCPIPLDYSDEEACYKCWFKWLIQEVEESE